MRRLLPLLLFALGGVSARAQEYGDPSGRALIAAADLRLTDAGGERGWLKGGYGKARFGDEGLRARPIEGDLTWTPEIAWSLTGHFALTAQQGQDKAIDLSEAYLSMRSAPLGRVRLSARAGLLWPPVSLEHAGPEWRVAETITPSAINSWIGEEVKGIAAEGTAALAIGDGRLYATAAIFGYNDTSGTLLSFRGWALHDQKATAFSYQPLPPLNAFMTYAQAPTTRPVIELDNRAGFYGRLGWSAGHARLEALYYDNRGDPEAYNPGLQWGWRTQFVGLGATGEAGRWRLTGQGMSGRTRMGFPRGARIWVDTTFRSAFLLASYGGDEATVSGRIEAFGTRGRGSVLGADEGEDGWGATLAGRRRIGDHLSVLVEVLHVDSERASRARVGLAPRQRQMVAQLSLRLRS